MWNNYFLWLPKFFLRFSLWTILLFSVFGGFYLSKLVNLQTFKLLNIIGISYDILGAIILSSMISKSKNWQKFIVKYFSVVVVNINMFLLIGMPLGAVWALTLHDTALLLIGMPLDAVWDIILRDTTLSLNFDDFPSAKTVLGFSAPILFPALFLNFFIEDTVIRGVIPKLSTLKNRSRFLGGTLIIIGFILQFAAALQDLLTL